MNKSILPGMSPTYENMARSVVQAQKKINGLNTSPTGTISVHRSNGTKDIYGVLNKDGYSVAKNVGDTVAPPKPKGIFATSSSDVVYVAWDGTLEDKIPSDFYNVTIYMGVGGQSSVIGTLTEHGIVSTPPLPTAQSVEVWATAEDDTCKEDGTPAHNVSPESTHQSVAIEHGSNSQGVEDLKKILEKKIDAVDVKAEQAATDVKGAKTMAKEASNKAAEVKNAVDDMANAFSHDESGAHIGDKDGVHTTIDSHGMKLLKGSEELAKFEQSAVSLGGGVFNIVDGYNYGKDDTKVTAVFAKHLLFNSGGAFFVNAPAIRFDVSDGQNRNTAKGIGLGSLGFIARDRTHRREEVIAFEDLAKLIKFTSWTTLQDDGVCRVRYCIRGGMLYLDCYLTAGYSTRTTTAQMPKELLPAIGGYHPLGTQTGNNTAKIWIGSADGNDGHIYFYNWSIGYATGIIPILPKSME